MMSINFFPLREQMLKEIERCISLAKLDTLTSFCNSCLFKLYESAVALECHTCQVHQRAKNIMQEARREPVDDEDMLGFC
ncbi:MAG TPA: hypothetical protein VL197_13310 [Nitrospirota bacterium]|jgi:hypothetical protein|nr:hypothetical protein [Nitrospirota bacterium]